MASVKNAAFESDLRAAIPGVFTGAANFFIAEQLFIHSSPNVHACAIHDRSPSFRAGAIAVKPAWFAAAERLLSGTAAASASSSASAPAAIPPPSEHDRRAAVDACLALRGKHAACLQLMHHHAPAGHAVAWTSEVVKRHFRLLSLLVHPGIFHLSSLSPVCNSIPLSPFSDRFLYCPIYPVDLCSRRQEHERLAKQRGIQNHHRGARRIARALRLTESESLPERL